MKEIAARLSDSYPGDGLLRGFVAVAGVTKGDADMVTISTVQRSYRQVPNLESRMSRESVLIERLVTLGVKVHAAYRIARCSPFSVVSAAPSKPETMRPPSGSHAVDANRRLEARLYALIGYG